MPLRLLTSLLLVATVLTCSARRLKTTHGKLKLDQPVTKVVEYNDTLRTGFDGIVFSGYDKAQNSSSETVFVTNNSDFYVKGINVSVEYLDEYGMQLHKTKVTLPCSLPRGETRSVYFKSWDKQHLWYYCNTQAQHNEYCTPFDVRIRINYIIIPADE